MEQWPLFVRRPAHGNQLLQHTGRAASRRKSRLLDYQKKIGAELPNAETREAIKEEQRMKADPALGKTYTDVDAMMEDLLK